MRSGSIDGGRNKVTLGPLKRSDSVRSAATVQMGAVGGGASGAALLDGAMLLRKSKTELSIKTTKKKNTNSHGNGAITGEGRAAAVRETQISPSSPADPKLVPEGGEQSNCVLM